MGPDDKSGLVGENPKEVVLDLYKEECKQPNKPRRGLGSLEGRKPSAEGLLAAI